MAVTFVVDHKAVRIKMTETNNKCENCIKQKEIKITENVTKKHLQ